MAISQVAYALVVALRIIETPSGPVLVDDGPAAGLGPPPPTRLELIAEKLAVDPDEYRLWLEDEIQRRLRARGDAWKQLDETLEKRASGH
jgi:hypothetical protein